MTPEQRELEQQRLIREYLAAPRPDLEPVRLLVEEPRPPRWYHALRWHTTDADLVRWARRLQWSPSTAFRILDRAA